MDQWNNIYKDIVTNFYYSIWKKPWPIWVGAIALAFANIFMFAYARAIGVFPQMAMWGSWIFNLLGIKVEAPFAAYPLTPLHLDVHSMIDFGIIFGVLISALLSQEFKLRKDDWQGYLVAIIGGVLMGFGTVLMPPCNVGGFYSATMALSLSGPVAAIGLLLGAYVGGLFLKWQVNRAANEVDFSVAPIGEPVKKVGASLQPYIGLTIGIILAVVAFIYFSLGKTKFTGLLLFGTLFGIIFQRSRLCMAGAFREIFISRDGTLMKWILFSIAIGAVGLAILKSQGYQPMHFILPVGLHTIFGGFVFGIGMVIAGGCGAGILWRSAEGYIRAWFAVVSGMLTAGSWVLIYGRRVGEGWLYGRPYSLGHHFGWFGGTMLIFLFLALFYLLIVYVEGKK